MQEVDIKADQDHSYLTIPGMKIEIETNSFKARTGIYLNSEIEYERRYDLEGINSNLMILDVKINSYSRIINLYRNFKPKTG